MPLHARSPALAAPARRPSGRRCAASLLLALLATTRVSAGPVTVQASDGAGKPLAGAAVWLESREAKAATKAAVGVEIGQAKRQFSQPVTVVPVGTAVSFPHRDTVRHHVCSFSAAKKFEIKLYVGTPAAPVCSSNGRPGWPTTAANTRRWPPSSSAGWPATSPRASMRGSRRHWRH